MTGLKAPKPTDHWCTPEAITSLLPEFDLDPCSNPNSTVRAKRRVMLPEDGLAVPWEGLVFCNPPYSNVMPWVQKAVSSKAAATTVFLLKLDPTTKWYEAVIRNQTQRPRDFRKHIRFAGAPCTANFPSTLLFVGAGEGVEKDRLRGPTGQLIVTLRDAGWIW